MDLLRFFEEEEDVAALVCSFFASGREPHSIVSSLPLVHTSWRRLLDRESMTPVWIEMSCQRWPGLRAASAQQLRVGNWKRWFRLRFLHLRDEGGGEQLSIENCAVGLQPASVPLPEGLVWKLQCPVAASKLQPTADWRVDYCTVCKKNVHIVKDEDDLQKKVTSGECVFVDYANLRKGAPPRSSLAARGFVTREALESERARQRGHERKGPPGAPKLWYSDDSEKPFLGATHEDLLSRPGQGVTDAPGMVESTSEATLELKENVEVVINQGGTMKGCSANGSLSFTAKSDRAALARVVVKNMDKSHTWNFRTPYLVKSTRKPYLPTSQLELWREKKFPLKIAVPIFHWSYTGDSTPPLQVICLPEKDEGTGTMHVRVRYGLTAPDFKLTSVNIVLSLGTTADPPTVRSIDGSYEHHPLSSLLCWRNDIIDRTNPTGVLDFSIPGLDEGVFFPLRIAYSGLQGVFCPVQIAHVNVGHNVTGTVMQQVLMNFNQDS